MTMTETSADAVAVESDTKSPAWANVEVVHDNEEEQ
jgi:hypothetical protein